MAVDSFHRQLNKFLDETLVPRVNVVKGVLKKLLDMHDIQYPECSCSGPADDLHARMQKFHRQLKVLMQQFSAINYELDEDEPNKLVLIEANIDAEFMIWLGERCICADDMNSAKLYHDYCATHHNEKL